MRKRSGEAQFTEVREVSGAPIDLIPGDDHGIRQFIWRMPLELACEDANYAMHAVDLYGRPSDPNGALSNIYPVSKQKLRPENPRASAVSNTITVAWDALPSCNGSLKGYTLFRSSSSYADCTTPPADSGYQDTGLTVTAPGTSIPDIPSGPTSGRWWYKVVANWYDWSSSNRSGLSAEVCISKDGQVAENRQDNEASYGMVAEVRHLGGLQASEMRIIGQSGGNNPAVKLSFYHVDHLGTPRVITDVSGNLVSKHKYLPFGEELTPPPSTNTHEFTGHERDSETGLDYMLARYFGSSHGRLMAVDPIVNVEVSFVNPQRWNRYTYVLQNPLRLGDASGLDADDRVAAARYYAIWAPVPYVWAGKAHNNMGGLDCSGFVQMIWNNDPDNRFQISEGNVDRLYNEFKRNGAISQQPHPGDVAFLERNGRLEHVGIVGTVNSDGSFNLIHQRGGSADRNAQQSQQIGHETTGEVVSPNSQGKYDRGNGQTVRGFGREESKQDECAAPLSTTGCAKKTGVERFINPGN
jgi:RHS repeat-associated protein